MGVSVDGMEHDAEQGSRDLDKGPNVGFVHSRAKAGLASQGCASKDCGDFTPEVPVGQSEITAAARGGNLRHA